MAQLSIEDGRVRIRITGLDRVLAFRGELSIPLEHVRGVSARPEEARRWFHGLKMPGSNLPGVITAGSFLTTGGFVFYDMHHADRTIALDLEHETYRRVIVELDEPPDEAVARIEAALAALSPEKRA